MGKGDGVGEGVYATTGDWGLAGLAGFCCFDVCSICVPWLFRGCPVRGRRDDARVMKHSRCSDHHTPSRARTENPLWKNNYFSREPTQKINYYFFEKASSSALRKKIVFLVEAKWNAVQRFYCTTRKWIPAAISPNQVCRFFIKKCFLWLVEFIEKIIN